MNLNLSWDLFILVFFGVVIAYSFIIGRNLTLKVITATYIAILCSDGIGNLFGRYLASSETFLKFMKLFGVGNSDQATAFFKVLVLIIMIVIIAIRGFYEYRAEEAGSMSIKLATTLVLGLLSAGLMMSAMLIFVSGSSLINNIFLVNNPLSQVYTQSRLVRIMLDFANIWFFMPGFAIVGLSFLHKK